MEALQNLLNIPFDCRIVHEISLDRFYNGGFQYDKHVKSIKTVGKVCGDEIESSKVYRYEEIIVLLIDLKKTDSIFDILRPIFSEIKYPVLAVMQYGARLRLSACHYNPGKLDSERNILGTPVFTSWFFPEKLSEKALNCIQEIGKAWLVQDVQKAYLQIHSAIACAQPINVTKNHALGIIKYLGPISNAAAQKMLLECTPFIKDYVVTGGTKFNPQKASAIHYRYDIEDIWNCVNNNPITAKSLHMRRINNAEELLYYADEYLYSDTDTEE